eukprot:12743543-Alexandrium_andersonii.AAC.1
MSAPLQTQGSHDRPARSDLLLIASDSQDLLDWLSWPQAGSHSLTCSPVSYTHLRAHETSAHP